MPLISIIVPVYNVEKYLPKCLDSLIMQTYPNIEIICVNDGSKDNSQHVLEEYAQKDARIKIINQENHGISVARNNGFGKATGDYILFVDADDWIDIETCEIINKSIEKNNSDLIIFNAYIAKNNQYHLGLRCNQENIMYSNLWSICYKKDFLDKYNIRFAPEIKIAEDHIFKLQTLIKTQNIKFLDDYLYYYFYREGSSSKVKSVIVDDIKSFEFTVNQEWFKNATNEQQENIIDFWIKLIGATLFSVSNENMDIEELKNFLKKVKKYQKEKGLKLKQIKYFELFVFLIRFKLFDLYRKLIRPIGKYCIVLPYRRLKNFLRSSNGK